MNSMRKDLVIIGGGPAGLAAACAAFEAGCKDILLLERDEGPGGILKQCIHNGFGLHTFKEELTGPEYGDRYAKKAEQLGICCYFQTIVVDISCGQTAADGESRPRSPVKYITAMNRERGIFVIEARSVILAMGCRERPRGALNIPGYRPAGIYSAGTAQRYVNIEGRMPGKEAVILGSGDIGLIMARRMTLEGARVKAVAELMPYSGGLKRNIVQCLDDFGIPLKLSTTVIDIQGKERVESVTLARVDEHRRPVPGTEEVISCDTLLLSCGLIPENELSEGLGVKMHPVTGGPVVNESLETSVPGVFACGNVLHVHDLVDYVSQEAAMAGACAAGWLEERGRNGGSRQELTEEQQEHSPGIPDREREEPGAAAYTVQTGTGIRYTVPSLLRPAYMAETQLLRFRVDGVYRNAELVVRAGQTQLLRQKKRLLAPGEMEQVTLRRAWLQDLQEEEELVVELILPESGETEAEGLTEGSRPAGKGQPESEAGQPSGGEERLKESHPAGESCQTQEMVCIRCPLGCLLTVTQDAEGRVRVTGNTCPRGAQYGEKELTAPTRTVTTTVRIRGCSGRTVPVRTAGEIPKEKIMECMKELCGAEVTLPVAIGDVVLENVAGTGVRVVAAGNERQ